MRIRRRGLLPEKFNARFRAKRLGLFAGTTLTAVTFSGVRTVFSFVFFCNAEPVPSELVIRIRIALANGTRSWRLRLKWRRNERCAAARLSLFS